MQSGINTKVDVLVQWVCRFGCAFCRPAVRVSADKRAHCPSPDLDENVPGLGQERAAGDLSAG